DAFMALVRRHGSMVYHTCLRAMVNEHDAEDAWQQTFMVLATRADVSRFQASLAGWLHETAVRVALKARTTAARRVLYERKLLNRPPRTPLDDVTGRELQQVLDEKLSVRN